MDSSEELCKSSNLFDTPSSQIQSLLSNLSLTGDSTPEQNITTSLRLVTDIPGTSDASFGEEVVPYDSPQPSREIHRIVFVLFQQKGAQTVYSPGWRQNFNTRDFAEVYDLTPVAAVYFNCQREGDLGGSRL
ncbi:protein HEADING DATE 3A-like isoform X1 [Chenopodium quinoa]|uniref:protein HEADING DATE 3A-like isoform X1 n=1 Tax=Chenopodium quinoa TaxID=63459 RepID=UPI000B78EDAB|nr:protein HEADING DATE 3A-like isoform X1 [Chenopodium quinoa]